MAEIKINIGQLEGMISKMNGFVADWSANKTNPPGTVGGGQTVSELEELTRIYKELNKAMVTLASNTALFLENIMNSYQASDSQAARGIKDH